ncbi:hypothetical protein D027_0329A, partial [Vibrio parahaemolyticus 861]|jgi:hypothetical protein
MLT